MDPEQDADFAREALFQHVGAGLLTGEGIRLDPDGPAVSRMGRNLLTEAEHATALRHARDLMGGAGDLDADSADQLAQEHADSPGVAYLRDNAEHITSQLATKQAKAAQRLLDVYGDVAKLKPSKAELDERIPAKSRIDQARWLLEVKRTIGDQLEAVPDSLAKPLRAKLQELGAGDDPAEWFQRASDLSDDLVHARADAGRAAKASELSDGEAHQTALDAAHRFLASGLAQQNIWGAAAGSEKERARSYEQRVGDHLGEFRELFTSRFGGQDRTDPDRFRELLQGDDAQAGPLRRALESTLEAARTTAGVAARFGRGDDARAILDAADELDATGAQGRAVQAARRGSQEPDQDAAARAGLSALQGDAGEQMGLGDDDARSGVQRAVRTFARASDGAARQGVTGMLAPRPEDSRGTRSGLAIAAPSAPTVTSDNFDAVRDHIDRMAHDPRYFGEVMGASFGRMPEADPETYAALSRQTAQTVNYLSAVAPGGQGGGPFAERIPVSHDELWDFQQRFAAVTDPEFVKAELRAGALSSQAIESYQVCCERSYFRLQMHVFEKLQQLKAAGIPVPTQAREQLDTLLDLDGGGDPALTWQVAERAEAAQQAHSKQLAIKGTSGDAAQGMQSSALATLQNGATAAAQTG